MSKTLVAYFSASGTTRRTAETLARLAGAELYEIRPAVPYTKEDLDWMNQNSRSSVEMRDKSSRPALADHDAPVAACDTVLIGFPIWWYVAPTLINTFLEAYDFSNKRVILFATSGSSGLGRTAEALRPSLAESAVIAGEKLLNGCGEADMLAWLKELKLA